MIYYYNILFTYDNKAFLGTLDDNKKSVIGYKQIEYKGSFDLVPSSQCAIVMIQDSLDGKEGLIPIQILEIFDEDKEPIILGELENELIIESMDNVYKDIGNIIRKN